MQDNARMYWSYCAYIISKQVTLCIYIRWSYLVFPSNAYLRESMNREISYTQWWDGHWWMCFGRTFYSAAKYTVLSFLHIRLLSRFLLDFSQRWVNISVRVISFDILHISLASIYFLFCCLLIFEEVWEE